MGSQPSRTDRLAEHLRYMRDVQQEDIPDAEEIARICMKFINAEIYPYARCSMRYHGATATSVPAQPSPSTAQAFRVGGVL